MTGLRVMPSLGRENDAGGRFTDWPGPDSHAAHRISADATASYASAARPDVARRADEADTGATPQAEGLVRARGPACFHTLPPPSKGRSRSISPSREGHRAPVAAVPCGDQPSAHRQGGSGGGAPARPLPRQRRGETRIVPRDDRVVIDIPDATPELIRAHRLDDEQALLAMVRYNRLIDTFLGLTTYSLQNHLRTTVQGMGQIEIDELYIGIDKHDCHYVIPVQAKGNRDQIGVVQTTQDIRFAEQRFPGMRCRAIAAQFPEDEVVALFQLTLQSGEIKVVEERHYRLVPADQLDTEAIRSYRP